MEANPNQIARKQLIRTSSALSTRPQNGTFKTDVPPKPRKSSGVSALKDTQICRVNSSPSLRLIPPTTSDTKKEVQASSTQSSAKQSAPSPRSSSRARIEPVWIRSSLPPTPQVTSPDRPLSNSQDADPPKSPELATPAPLSPSSVISDCSGFATPACTVPPSTSQSPHPCHFIGVPSSSPAPSVRRSCSSSRSVSPRSARLSADFIDENDACDKEPDLILDEVGRMLVDYLIQSSGPSDTAAHHQTRRAPIPKQEDKNAELVRQLERLKRDHQVLLLQLEKQCIRTKELEAELAATKSESNRRKVLLDEKRELAAKAAAQMGIMERDMVFLQKEMRNSFKRITQDERARSFKHQQPHLTTLEQNNRVLPRSSSTCCSTQTQPFELLQKTLSPRREGIMPSPKTLACSHTPPPLPLSAASTLCHGNQQQQLQQQHSVDVSDHATGPCVNTLMDMEPAHTPPCSHVTSTVRGGSDDESAPHSSSLSSSPMTIPLIASMPPTVPPQSPPFTDVPSIMRGSVEFARPSSFLINTNLDAFHDEHDANAVPPYSHMTSVSHVVACTRSSSTAMTANEPSETLLLSSSLLQQQAHFSSEPATIPLPHPHITSSTTTSTSPDIPLSAHTEDAQSPKLLPTTHHHMDPRSSNEATTSPLVFSSTYSISIQPSSPSSSSPHHPHLVHDGTQQSNLPTDGPNIPPLLPNPGNPSPSSSTTQHNDDNSSSARSRTMPSQALAFPSPSKCCPTASSHPPSASFDISSHTAHLIVDSSLSPIKQPSTTSANPYAVLVVVPQSSSRPPSSTPYSSSSSAPPTPRSVRSKLYALPQTDIGVSPTTTPPQPESPPPPLIQPMQSIDDISIDRAPEKKGPVSSLVLVDDANKSVTRSSRCQDRKEHDDWWRTVRFIAAFAAVIVIK